jgi:hypothetical protein
MRRMINNPGVFEIYRSLKAEVDAKRANIAHEQKQHATQEERMVEMLNRWHSGLRSLVGHLDKKFAQSFREMGCIGQIELRVPSNEKLFDKWFATTTIIPTTTIPPLPPPPPSPPSPPSPPLLPSSPPSP